MKPNQVKITTTSNIEGVEIEEYLEPISAHVVIGMNFFKDFLSGFTDFFGGKSSSYQKTLASINENVLDELRKKAFAIGANCVLGLKIDNDEISAQGKSMLMVTAMGTAVKAKISYNKDETPSQISSGRLSNNFLQVLKTKDDLIDKANSDQLQLTPETWEFIKSNSVIDLLGYVLDVYIQNIKNSDPSHTEQSNKLTDQVTEFVDSLDKKESISIFYDKIKQTESNKALSKLFEVAGSCYLLDLNAVGGLLRDQDKKVNKIGIRLCSLQKESYEKSDIDLIEKILQSASEKFPKRGDVTSKKKVFSSNEKSIWKCECGKENDIEKTFCGTCKNDIYGFNQSECSFISVRNKLQQEVNLLRKTLK